MGHECILESAKQKLTLEFAVRNIRLDLVFEQHRLQEFIDSCSSEAFA